MCPSSRPAKAVPSRGPLQAALAVPHASSGGATKESVVDLASLAVLPSREASDDREPLVVIVATMPAVPQGLRCRECPRPSSAPLVPRELPVEVRKTLSSPQARRFMNCAVSSAPAPHSFQHSHCATLAEGWCCFRNMYFGILSV